MSIPQFNQSTSASPRQFQKQGATAEPMPEQLPKWQERT
jgi:hypothetical protein